MKHAWQKVEDTFQCKKCTGDVVEEYLLYDWWCKVTISVYLGDELDEWMGLQC